MDLLGLALIYPCAAGLARLAAGGEAPVTHVGGTPALRPSAAVALPEPGDWDTSLIANRHVVESVLRECVCVYIYMCARVLPVLT